MSTSKKLQLPYELKEMRLSELKPHPKQAATRQITDDALRGLKGSLSRFGVLEEIIVNKRTGHILSGHQRWKVLTQGDGTKTAPVKVVDVSKIEEDAIFWTMNNPAVCGTYTDAARLELLDIKVELGELYSDVGLDMLEVSLPFEPEEPQAGLTDPDEVPEERKTNVKLGDLFGLGSYAKCPKCGKEHDLP
jgi:hypothetical protein